MRIEINPGDRVEVTRTAKGGFYKGRYLATVLIRSTTKRVKVRDDLGKEYSPYITHIKKLG